MAVGRNGREHAVRRRNGMNERFVHKHASEPGSLSCTAFTPSSSRHRKAGMPSVPGNRQAVPTLGLGCLRFARLGSLPASRRSARLIGASRMCDQSPSLATVEQQVEAPHPDVEAEPVVGLTRVDGPSAMHVPEGNQPGKQGIRLDAPAYRYEESVHLVQLPRTGKIENQSGVRNPLNTAIKCSRACSLWSQMYSQICSADIMRRCWRERKRSFGPLNPVPSGSLCGNSSSI